MDVQSQRIQALFDDLQAYMIQWLQSYTGRSDENLGSLLLDEKILYIEKTVLNNMLKSLEHVAPEVEIILYSLQPDPNETQTFHIEIKQKSSNFSFNTPLQSLLAPEHEKSSDVVSFFEYVFIQIAALQYAFEVGREITPQYIEGILKNFYKNHDKKERIEEEHSMLTNTIETEDHKFLSDLDNEDLKGSSVNNEKDQSIDFEALNEGLDVMFKLLPRSERSQLKRLKADVWELEMTLEETGLKINDVSSLAYTILEMESDDPAVMKWQIATAKQLLNMFR